jgi:flagellar L-ring protein FlgH
MVVLMFERIGLDAGGGKALQCRALRACVMAALALMASACSQVPLREMPNDPDYAPLGASTPPPDFHSQGAIQYAGFGSSLFSDRRAMQVGDIITVRLTERTAASKDADTEISKESDIQFNEGTVLGDTVSLGNYSLDTNVTQNRNFNAEAESSQSNSLSGSITVSVVEVLPNGLLRVRGEKWLQLNRGSEYIRLTGMVRQQDIGPDNSVASTKLADARIGYSGTGELAEANKMGWVSRFFNSAWWPL